MIFDLVKRVFYRNYWFYWNVIGEKDKIMTFYYSAFAFSMYVIFLFWGGLNYLAYYTESEIFNLGQLGKVIGAFVILGLFIFFFFKGRKSIEKEAQAFKEPFIWKDVIVLIYIIFCFIFYFISMDFFRI